MATTSSTSTSTAPSVSTSAALMASLGAGSGIDINTLAQNLVNAEMQPQLDAVKAKITQDQAQISGYSTLKYLLSQLGNAFGTLSNASSFQSVTAVNTQPNAFSVTSTGSTAVSNLNVQVNQIAKGQQSVSGLYASDSQSLNGGQPLAMNLVVGGTTYNISTVKDTPASIVAAINAKSSVTQVTAQLVDTGSGFRILLAGATGQSNSFSLQTHLPTTPTVNTNGGVFTDVTTAGVVNAVHLSYDTMVNGTQTTLTQDLVQDANGHWVLPDNFQLPADASNLTATADEYGVTQTAQDAKLNVNGIDITRPTNEIKNAINGITLNLLSTTTSTANVSLSRDTSGVVTNINGLVTAYNDFLSNVGLLTQKPASTTDTTQPNYVGSLPNDSLVNTVVNAVKRFITNNSSTAGQFIQAGRDVGLSFDRNGKLQLDNARLTSALNNHFDEVVNMFSAGTDNHSVYSLANQGMAGDALRTIDQWSRSTGLIDSATQSVNGNMTRYNDQLTTLKDRMDKMLQNYITQFSNMNDLVGQSNSTMTSLKNTFAQKTSN